MTESISPFKGIPGGDPARRPPKIEATHPCKNCGKPHTAVTDFGQASKHVCEECMDAKRSGHRCKMCNSRKGSLIWHEEIFTYETHYIVEEGYFHAHCLESYRETAASEWP